MQDEQRLNSVSWSDPPDTLLLNKNTVHVWRVGLQQSSEVIGRCGALLTPDEQDRARRFHFDRDRRRYIVCRGALRFLLSRYLVDRSPDALRFEYSQWGKPCLVPAGVSFNVSHSGEWGLIAICREGELGVDIEQIKEMADMADMVESVFSLEEQHAWRAYEKASRPVAFFSGWTRKEAVVKAVGQGLSIPLKSFVVELTPQAAVPQISLPDWHPRSFVPHRQFMGAVVCSRPIEELLTFDFDFRQ